MAGEQVSLNGDEVVAKLRAGEELPRVALAELTLSGEFPDGAALPNSEIGKLTISDARFYAKLRLRGCKIHRLQISGAEFADGVDLRNAKLDFLAIKSSETSGPVRLDNADITRAVHITACHFLSELRLWETRFHGWLEIKDCSFKARADLRSLNAEEGIVLSGCHFHEDVVIRGASVTKKFDFADSTFEKLVDFSKAKLHDFIYLEGINQGDGQRFAFLNAIGDRVLIRADQVEGRLATEGDGNHTDAMHEFAFLKRNYSSLHRYEDEDWAFYRFKVSQRRASGGSWWKPWTKLSTGLSWLFLDRGCGYGARPFRAVLSALIIIVLFGLIYMGGLEKFDTTSHSLRDLPADNWANRTLFGMTTSVSVFTAGFTGEHLRSAEGWMLVPLAVEALLGTLLWGLFVVAFSRKIIR